MAQGNPYYLPVVTGEVIDSIVRESGTDQSGFPFIERSFQLMGQENSVLGYLVLLSMSSLGIEVPQQGQENASNDRRFAVAMAAAGATYGLLRAQAKVDRPDAQVPLPVVSVATFERVLGRWIQEERNNMPLRRLQNNPPIPSMVSGLLGRIRAGNSRIVPFDETNWRSALSLGSDAGLARFFMFVVHSALDAQATANAENAASN